MFWEPQARKAGQKIAFSRALRPKDDKDLSTTQGKVEIVGVLSLRA